MKNTNGNSKFILGILIGGIVGGISALMLAPQSGNETQQMILEKKDGLRREAEKRIHDGRNFTANKMGEVRNTVADLLATGSDLLENKSKEIEMEMQENSEISKKEKTSA